MSDDKSWIYVIVMIVLSIIGSINKSKKKNTSAPTPPTEEDDEFPTIFFPKTAPEVLRPLEPVKAASRYVAMKEEPGAEEGRSVFAQPQEVSQKTTGQPEEDNGGFVPDFQDKDELKRAVVYSEILNRKFF